MRTICDRLAGDLPAGVIIDPDPPADGDERWRVFVILRERHGVYGRVIRAADPLGAERSAVADRNVVATLGWHPLGRVGAEPDQSGYRRLEAAGRRFAEVNRARRTGTSSFVSLPLVEILTASEASTPSIQSPVPRRPEAERPGQRTKRGER